MWKNLCQMKIKDNYAIYIYIYIYIYPSELYKIWRYIAIDDGDISVNGQVKSKMLFQQIFMYNVFPFVYGCNDLLAHLFAHLAIHFTTFSITICWIIKCALRGH